MCLRRCQGKWRMVTPPVTRWSSSPFSFFGFFFTWDVDMLLLNMMYVSGYMNRHKMNIYWNIYWNDMALIYTTFSYCSQCLTWCNLFVTTNHMGPRREYLAKCAFTQMVTQILWGECSYLSLTYEEIQKNCVTCLQSGSPWAVRTGFQPRFDLPNPHHIPSC